MAPHQKGLSDAYSKISTLLQVQLKVLEEGADNMHLDGFPTSQPRYILIP